MQNIVPVFFSILLLHGAWISILLLLGTARFFSRYGMVSTRSIKTKENNLWVFIRGIKSNRIVFIGNINVSWKRIGGIAGSFVWSRTIIKRHVREIQRWLNTINYKGVVEAVKNFPFVVLYHLKLLLTDLLWNTTTDKELCICYTHNQHPHIRKSKISTLCHPIFI